MFIVVAGDTVVGQNFGNLTVGPELTAMLLLPFSLALLSCRAAVNSTRSSAIRVGGIIREPTLDRSEIRVPFVGVHSDTPPVATL